MAVLRVAKRKLVVDFVMVPAAVAGFAQVAGSLQIANDLRCGSFGDADSDGDVSKSCGRVGGDAFEHVSVVRYEPPEMVVLSRT
jgi:hypothetical protein